MVHEDTGTIYYEDVQTRRTVWERPHQQAPGSPPAPISPPIVALTHAPTDAPTNAPTNAPTDVPTHAATDAPTHVTTNAPTNAPTLIPTTKLPAGWVERVHAKSGTVFYEDLDTLRSVWERPTEASVAASRAAAAQIVPVVSDEESGVVAPAPTVVPLPTSVQPPSVVLPMVQASPPSSPVASDEVPAVGTSAVVPAAVIVPAALPAAPVQIPESTALTPTAASLGALPSEKINKMMAERQGLPALRGAGVPLVVPGPTSLQPPPLVIPAALPSAPPLVGDEVQVSIPAEVPSALPAAAVQIPESAALTLPATISSSDIAVPVVSDEVPSIGAPVVAPLDVVPGPPPPAAVQPPPLVTTAALPSASPLVGDEVQVSIPTVGGGATVFPPAMQLPPVALQIPESAAVTLPAASLDALPSEQMNQMMAERQGLPALRGAGVPVSTGLLGRSSGLPAPSTSTATLFSPPPPPPVAQLPPAVPLAD